MTQTKIEAGKWYRHRHHGPVKVLTGEVYPNATGSEMLVDCVVADGRDRFRLYVSWLEPCSPPTTEKAVGSLFGVDVTTQSITPPSAPPPTMRDVVARYFGKDERYPHTCTRCGSPAYHGITSEECSQNTECGRELEPTVDRCILRHSGGPLRLAADSMYLTDDGRRYLLGSQELGYEAHGKGISKYHPTREGAIMAWREAVKR